MIPLIEIMVRVRRPCCEQFHAEILSFIKLRPATISKHLLVDVRLRSLRHKSLLFKQKLFGLPYADTCLFEL